MQGSDLVSLQNSMAFAVIWKSNAYIGLVGKKGLLVGAGLVGTEDMDGERSKEESLGTNFNLNIHKNVVSVEE
jgi:hypothetical protein